MRSNENVIEWLNGDKQISCTISQGKFITKILKLIEKYPEDVEITNNGDYKQDEFDKLDDKDKSEIRNNAKQEIGNKLLLTGTINTKNRNYIINEDDNIKPNKWKNIRKYTGDLLLNNEFIETFKEKNIWNEKTIRERTNKLFEYFKKIYPFDIE